MRRTFLYGTILFVLILLFSLGFIAFKTFSKETLSAFMSLKRRYILASVFVIFLYHTFDNLRLFVLSKALGVKYSFKYGYMVSFINTFAATVTPAHVGGEMSSVYMLVRKGAGLHKVMSIVTMKTITGASFFLLMLPVTGYYLYKHPEAAVNMLKLLLIVIGISAFVFLMGRLFVNKKGNEHLKDKLKKSLKQYVIYMKIFGYKRKKVVFLAVLFSIALYLCFLLVAPTLILAFGKDIDIVHSLFAQLGLLYAIFISPSPGGSGVGELGGLVVFANFLNPYEIGLFVLLWRFISQYISAMLGGVLFLICLWIDLRR